MTGDTYVKDGVVYKETGPWTPSIRALLTHLETAGFGGAPRIAGQGYTYLAGSSPHPHAWPDDVVGEVGSLLRDLHDATSDFIPGACAVWKRSWLRDLGGHDIVYGHGDTAPWNIVGPPLAFIDWEFAGPVDRLWELAHTVWLNAHLVDDDVADLQDLPDATTRARHARAIVDGYGLPQDQRGDLVDRLVDVAAHSARHEVAEHAVTPSTDEAVAADGYPVLWAIAWRARSASWIARHRPQLRRAICDQTV